MSVLVAVVLVGMVGCRTPSSTGDDLYRTDAERGNGDTRQAEQLHRQAIEALEAGDTVRAERLLRQSLSADVMFGPAHNTLGSILLEQRKFYEAAWEFQYAARLLPHHAEPRNNLGLVYERIGRLKDAMAEYASAHEQQPEDHRILGNLVRTRIRMGLRDEHTRSMLEQLLLREDRPDWRQWEADELSRMKGAHP